MSATRSDLLVRFRVLARAAGLLVAVTGTLVLAGWFLDIRLLKSVAPGLATMKVNTAIGAVLAGLSLWASTPVAAASDWKRGAARAAAVLVTSIGLVTLAEYLIGWDLRVDELLVEDLGTAATAYPGRMSLASAVSLALIGLALLGLDAPGRYRSSALLAMSATLIGLLALLGYAFGVSALYAIGAFSSMAVHSALLVTILGAGIIFARPERWPASTLASDSAGGITARRLLPAVVVLPALLGWLRLAGERLDLYDTAFGLALMVASTIALLAIVVWWTAADLGRIDEARHRLNDELEQRVLDRTAELAATNKELEAFTYSVAHDLRAPLRQIEGFSRLLGEEAGGSLPESAQVHLSRIREGTHLMGQLIEDLLKLSRVGRQELHRQITNLNALVEEVVAHAKLDTAGRTIEWRLQSLPFAECDPGLLREVFVNLIANAAKFTRLRDPAVIEVGSTADGSAIFVRDNGVGFNMKYADKLFGIFQRLHRQEDFEGTGVGLATVQRIVHRHGGRVWAEAELNKGATFYFTLGTLERNGPARHAGQGGGS